MELVSFIIMFLIVGGVIAGVAAVSKGSIEDLRKMQEYRNFQQNQCQNQQQNQYQNQYQNPQNIPDAENPVSINPTEQEEQQNRIEPASVIPPKPEFLQPPLYTFQPPVKIKPEKKRAKLPASAVMLIIGTIFIILSALTFVVANWVKFEPIGRVGALAGSAALAFTICALMKAVAGLERTSGAFYTIGTIFTSISFLTAGYYG
ncbi:MAG: hypothetical protein K2J26_00970, partial [Ruminococcus sp.]|nr:hypothetical protein [Ruminococcus sp.]